MSTPSKVQFLQHKKRYFFLEICSVILVQDTARTLRVKLDILRISSSPLSVRLSHWINFSTSRFGREFTPTPTPVMLEPDKSNSLILLLDLFNISISPWSDNDFQKVSTSFSRLGRVLPSTLPNLERLVLTIQLYLQYSSLYEQKYILVEYWRTPITRYPSHPLYSTHSLYFSHHSTIYW